MDGREVEKKYLTARCNNGIWCDSKSSKKCQSHSNNNTDMRVSILCAKWRRTHPIASALDRFWPTLSRDGIGYTNLIQLERSHIRTEQGTCENEGKPNASDIESGKERNKKKRTGFMWTVLSTYISWNNVFCIPKTQTKSEGIRFVRFRLWESQTDVSYVEFLKKKTFFLSIHEQFEYELSIGGFTWMLMVHFIRNICVWCVFTWH